MPLSTKRRPPPCPLPLSNRRPLWELLQNPMKQHRAPAQCLGTLWFTVSIPYKSILNKRWITLTVVYCRSFASKAVFWAILKDFEYAVYVPNNRRTREESLFRKGSSAGAIFPQKIASLRFQTSQRKGWKIHASPRAFRSKIHPKGPELALEEN